MTATKTKEFAAEMKVLCKVHHSNLVIPMLCISLLYAIYNIRDYDFWVGFLFLSKVELIGYAASNDELFVVYEYVQKGMLKNHLHDPQSKGKEANTNKT